RPDRDHVVGLFLGRVQGRCRLHHPHPGAHLPADRHSRPAGGREGMSDQLAAPAPAVVRPAVSGVLVDAFKNAGLSALVALGLFSLLIGVRTEQGPTGALEVTMRPQLLAALVAAVFVGSLIREIVFRSGALQRVSVLPPAAASQSGMISRVAGAALLVV